MASVVSRQTMSIMPRFKGKCVLLVQSGVILLYIQVKACTVKESHLIVITGQT